MNPTADHTVSTRPPTPVKPLTPTQRWQRFLLAVIRVIEKRVQSVPRKTALGYGVALGNLANALAKRPRNTARKNLRLIYGDAMSEAERNEMVRRVFVHFAMMAMDFLRGPIINTPEALAALIESVEGWEENVAPVMAEKRGIILLTAHLGNWELLGRYVASRGLPLTVVARDPEDEAFAAWAKRMRETAGFAVSSRGDSVRRLLTTLKQGEALGILPDQNSGDLFIPFFGIPTGTVMGPAVLAIRANAVIIPCYAVRDPDKDNRYRLFFENPIPTDATGDREADHARIMTEGNLRLERRIREWPEQWLWLHDRWKGTFEEKNRDRLPKGFNLAPLWERWR